MPAKSASQVDPNSEAIERAIRVILNGVDHALMTCSTFWKQTFSFVRILFGKLINIQTIHHDIDGSRLQPCRILRVSTSSYSLHTSCSVITILPYLASALTSYLLFYPHMIDFAYTWAHQWRDSSDTTSSTMALRKHEYTDEATLQLVMKGVQAQWWKNNVPMKEYCTALW